MKRNQVFTIVTIAAISFLIGTMFSVIATESGNPWDRVWTAITGLESRVETLEKQSLPQGFITAPAYDSGWVPAYTGSIYQTFEHGLNTTHVLVSLTRKDTNRGINQVWYWYGNGEMTWFNLTENYITIEMGSASMANDDIRVMIWKISEPPT